MTTKAFLFWYKTFNNSPTTYIWVIAKSAKQAVFFLRQNGFTNFADYSLQPCEVKTTLRLKHRLGAILGDKAII